MSEAHRQIETAVKPDNAVYYFSHIPKTAGTSFTTILDRFFHVKFIFQPQLWWEVGKVDAVRNSNYQCFRGHFGMGAQMLSRHHFHTLTLLRDPVSLAFSTYQYVKREKNTGVHDYVIDQKLTFEQFLLDSKTSNLSKNRLIKSLSFGMEFPDDVQGVEVSPETYGMYRRQWNKLRKTMSSEELLGLVKNYLNEAFWIGFVEEFEVSVLMLCYQMSWPPIGPTTKLNSHNKAAEISPEAIELIKQKNTLDFELYDCAKISFEKKLSDFCEQHNLAVFDVETVSKLVDENYQKNYLTFNHLNLTNGIIYDFSMILLGVNWHRREWHAEKNTYFRWTGPENHSSIDFWLVPADYQVSLYFINLIGEEVLNHLELSVNGNSVNWTMKRQGNEGEIEFFCEQSMTQNHGLFRLTIATQGSAKHDAVFNSKDNRCVGMALKQIKITSTGV